jgi:hypothetical protein
MPIMFADEAKRLPARILSAPVAAMARRGHIVLLKEEPLMTDMPTRHEQLSKRARMTVVMDCSRFHRCPYQRCWRFTQLFCCGETGRKRTQ